MAEKTSPIDREPETLQVGRGCAAKSMPVWLAPLIVIGSLAGENVNPDFEGVMV